jgi:hypothetical protein
MPRCGEVERGVKNSVHSQKNRLVAVPTVRVGKGESMNDCAPPLLPLEMKAEY